MTQQPYMAEPWYSLLVAACKASSGAAVARGLGVSEPLVYQVLNGTGHYGNGRASTQRFALKVQHQLGRFVCPHLTEQAGEERVITSEECRRVAHGSPPTSSPRALAHWQACRQCPKRGLSAPPAPRVPGPARPARGSRKPTEAPPATTPKESP